MNESDRAEIVQIIHQTVADAIGRDPGPLPVRVIEALGRAGYTITKPDTIPILGTNP